MTIEDSKAMWQIEKSNVDLNMLSKPMQKLYKIVNKVIMDGIITYEDFTNDMLDETTTSIIENTKSEEIITRAMMVDNICKKLSDKYETKYKDRKSSGRDKELLGDNSEVQA